MNTGFVRMLHDIATARPGDVAVTFVDFRAVRAGTTSELTFGELDRRARAIARLVANESDEPVAIMCPHGPEYVIAVLGCLYANVIGVPLYVPEIFRTDERLPGVLADCRPRAILTTRPYADLASELAVDAGVDKPEIIRVEDATEADGWIAPVVNPDRIAYLQYTSGSTRAPAGVEVTHGNVTNHMRQAADCIELTADSVMVSWLPFFHDFGLVLTVLTTLSTGAHTIYFSPISFVQTPIRWLRLITAYRATHTAAPNFGLEQAVERISPEQRAGLDLSSLRALINSSEMIRASTLSDFDTAYSEIGFTPASHLPGYGLAEATLAVTAVKPGHGATRRGFARSAIEKGYATAATDPDDTWTLVGCGRVLAGGQVVIVDPETVVGPETPAEKPGGSIGEVWVRGASVSPGYWHQTERTAEVFDWRLDGQDGWLRTGDLGFFDRGELFITGRLKDIIVVDGHNHHAVDIENTVQAAHPAVRPGHVVAFSVDDGNAERLVVVVESTGRDQLSGAEAAIRELVSSRHALSIADLVFAGYAAIPKTSSGKLRRGACRDRYRAGTLPRLAHVPRSTHTHSTDN